MDQLSWKILIVDDDEEDYFLARQMLSEARRVRFLIDWASTYDEAWHKLQNQTYDAVLMDYDLGAHNGLELTRRAVDQECPFPIILFTGRGSEEVDMQAMQAGAALYLTKGEANPLLLERGIRYAIERKQNETSLRQANHELACLNREMQEELAWREQAEALLEERNAALEEAHERQHMALTSAQAGVWEWDIVNDRVSWSAELFELFGVNSRHPVACLKDFIALIHPDDREQTASGLKAALQQGGPFNLAFRIVRPDGGEIWASGVGSVELDASGRAVFARGINQDITQLKRAELAHRESERQQQKLAESLETERARLAAILENLPVGVWIADRDGRLLDKNQQADQIWAGEAPLLQEIESYPQYIARYPGSPKQLEPEEYPMARALREGTKIESVELEIQRFDGSSGNVLVSSQPIWNQDGEIVGAVGINVDISEYKRISESLCQSEERFAKAFDATPNALAISRLADGKIELVNEAFGRLFGHSQAEAIGRTSVELNMLPDARQRETTVQQIRAEKSVRNLETEIRLKSGEIRQASLSIEMIDIDGEPYILTVIEDITERKQAEALLRASEARWRALISASAQVLYSMSPDWKEMRALQGGSFLANTERPNRNWLAEYIHPDDQEYVLAQIENAIQRGIVFDLEHRVLQADGSLGWTASRAVPVRNGEGEVVEWFGAASDITARKLAELEQERLLAENLQQRAFLERLIQAAPVAIAVLEGPEHRYRLANPHQEHLARGKGNLLGRSVAQVWSEGPQQVLPILDNVYQSGEPFSAHDIPFQVVRDNGPETAYFDVSYVPLRDGQGQVEGILAMALETTGQVQDRKALEAEQARLWAVINNAPSGIVVTDEKARILLTNELANQLYDRPVPFEQDFASHAALEICYPDGSPYDPRHLPLTRSALDGETYTNLEMLIRWPDGQRRPLLVNTAPIRDGQGAITGAVGVFQDISRLKQAEADLESYAQRLEQSNRDLQDFAFMASHDLQEPLRKVLAFAEQLHSKAGPKLNAEELDYLARMSGAARRMSQMLQGVLSYSRVTTKAQPHTQVDLARIAGEILQVLDLQVENSGGQVAIGEMAVIEAEPIQMRQLFQNLIANALKFARPGAPPQVQVSCRRLAPSPEFPVESVEIRVEDNGIGFAPEGAGQLFQPFHRLVGRSQFEGSGMGLAICRRIAERHGGSIRAESQPGEGAAFIVRLPVKQGDSS